MSSVRRSERSASRALEDATEPARRSEAPSPPALVLALQRGAGNQAVAGVIARGKNKKKGGGKAKKSGGGGGVGTATPQAGESTPKPKVDPVDRAVAKLRGEADQAKSKATKAKSRAAECEQQAADAIESIEGLLTDPMVTANLDVLATVEGAEKTAKTASADATRHANTVRKQADDAIERAKEVNTTEPDRDGFGSPTFKLDEALRKAKNFAEEATKAVGRTETALKQTQNALKSAQRAREQIEHAKTWVTESKGDADQKAGAAIKAANTWSINVDRLTDLRRDAKRPVADEQWRDRRADLTALEAEADKILGFAGLISDAKDRAKPGTMSHVDMMAVQALITPAVIELGRSGRDDVAARDKLKKIGEKLDQIDAAADALADNADEINALKLDGRYSQNKTKIPLESRAGLTGQEKTNVDEILDAYDDGDTASPFGGRWNDYHGNNGGDLPGIRGAGGYTEFYVRKVTGDTSGYWGARRLVRHNDTGRWYFSRTHYGSNGTPAFVRLGD
ncbi:MAG TPA: hypothetical protein VI300_25790 [Solirubrobacter sp.]